MASLPKIIDNKRKVFIDLFNDLLPQYKKLSIATGYWDLKAMVLLMDKLDKYDEVRILIGREPLIPRHNLKCPEPDFPQNDIFNDLEQLQPTNELRNIIQRIKKKIDSGNLQVKIYRKEFLHAKCYIFGDYNSDDAIGIIGSSNFTKNGLTTNAELNSLEDDCRIVTFQPKDKKQEIGHLFWFDQIWEMAEDWNGKFKTILEESPVGDILFSPYETYIKTLHDLYREELEEENIDTSIKGSHDLYDFQTKNVHALVRRLNKYKVAMLADSVGLGKTYTAIEVIKQYLTGDKGLQRVEIICPKSLVSQWQTELTTQGVVNLKPITLQNAKLIEDQKKLDNIASVSLFVIDESHNLKNRSGKRFDQIIEWVRNNPKAHVLLLTATPINNQLSDIVNQILIGTRGESSILKVTAVDKKLKQTTQIDFYQAIENLKKKINQDNTRNGSVDYEYIKQIMAPILRAFVVRRTRQGIEKEYGGLRINGVEKKFPKVMPEIKKYGFKPEITNEINHLKSNNLDLEKIYKLSPEGIIENTKKLAHPLDQLEDIEQEYLNDDLNNMPAMHFVYQIILLLGFVPYRWKMYQTKYYGKSRAQIKEMKLSSQETKLLFLQLSIYGILRTMFLKRLESSVSAIRSSLETYKRKLSIFERGLDVGKIVSLKDLINIEQQLMFGDEDFDPEEIEIDSELELDDVDDKKYVIEEMRADIAKEKDLIDILDRQLRILEKDDSKITAFAELLEQLKKDKPAGKKVLVFSFYADTVNYLQETLPKYANFITADNSAFLSSKNRVNAESIAGRFSPQSKKYEIKDDETELNYLFSTDILSEGQNLQDCGILINYDLHWNPVRMIQRNGRINRIGTDFPEVYIYNINPEDQLEQYLKIVERLEGKINLIRNTIGTDSPVLDEQENPIEFTDSWEDIYSENMQKRIEALERAEKDSDLLLSEDEYVSDLKIFHNDREISEEYKQKIYNIPNGKWAIMPQEKNKGENKPEVMSLNSLYGDDESIAGHAFVSMKRDGNDFQAVVNLQALEWLKTTPENNKHIQDNISLDKIKIAKKTDSSIEAYVSESETGSPVGQQTEILRMMYEQHFSEEDIEKVEAVFGSTNVLDKQKITKLTRRVVRSKKDNVPYLEYINKILQIAKKIETKDSGTAKFDHIRQTLFYVNKND